VEELSLLVLEEAGLLSVVVASFFVAELSPVLSAVELLEAPVEDGLEVSVDALIALSPVEPVAPDFYATPSFEAA